MKNIYIIHKLTIIIILFKSIFFDLNKLFLKNILYNFFLFLFKDISNLNYSFVMMNENNNNNKDVNPSNLSENLESNINESKRIERIENWFNQGLLDDDRKEELIKSGKDFDKNELDAWSMEQDKLEYLLNQKEEQEKTKKIYEWLNDVEEPSNTQTSSAIKPNSKPTSQWSPSGSEEGNPSISNINSNMDQIKDYVNSEEFFNDINYLMISEYFIIYVCYFLIIFICFLIVYYVIEKKFI